VKYSYPVLVTRLCRHFLLDEVFSSYAGSTFPQSVSRMLITVAFMRYCHLPIDVGPEAYHSSFDDD